MAVDLAKYIVSLEAQTAQYVRELDKANAKLTRFEAQNTKSLAAIEKGFTKSFGLIKTALGAFGIALSVRAIAGFVGRTLEAAENLKNLSDRLGVSVEALSELQYAAKIADVPLERLTQSMQFLARAVGTGNKGLAELGLSVQQLRALSIDQQFKAVSAALAQVGDKSKQVALAMQLFGRGGAEILQLVGDLEKLTQEAHTVGAVITDEMATAAAEARDNMDRLRASSDALGTVLGVKLVPFLNAATKALTELIGGVSQYDQILRRVTALTEDRFKAEQKLEDLLARGVGNDRARTLASNLRAEISALNKELETLNAQLVEMREGEAATSTGAGYATFIQNTLAAASAASAERGMAPLAPLSRMRGATDFGVPQVGEGIQPIITSQEMFEEQLKLEQEFQDKRIEAAEKAAETRKRIEASVALEEKRLAEDRMAFEQQAQDFKMQTAFAAAGFLQALGAEHRGAAIAALALQKVLTLKQIFFSGQAQARAEAAWASIFGGPGAAAAAFARVMTQTKIQMGLVAATGLVEASQLSSGGTRSTLGTSANPLVTRDSSGGVAAASSAAQRQTAVQVIIQGDMYGWDEYIRRRVIEGIRQAVDGRDVVIIGPNSRQAELLRDVA